MLCDFLHADITLLKGEGGVGDGGVILSECFYFDNDVVSSCHLEGGNQSAVSH